MGKGKAQSPSMLGISSRGVSESLSQVSPLNLLTYHVCFCGFVVQHKFCTEPAVTCGLASSLAYILPIAHVTLE